MKIIHQHNLEEWLFDYFEGNLNESDKVMLMDYVENNPGAEKEFGYWKKSYQPLNEPKISVADFQNSLLKPTWFGKYKYYVLASTSIVLLGLVTIFYSKTETATKPTIIESNNSENQVVEPIIEAKTSSKKFITKPKVANTISPKTDSKSIETPFAEERELHIIEPINSIKPVEIKPITASPSEVKEIKLDSLPPSNTNSQPALPKKKPKKRKVSGYNFEPVNDNF
ncbi:MAG: hypothetical protein RLZZ175_1278 [Bacteroidota bacterium]|jgi:hypothetical protein